MPIKIKATPMRGHALRPGDLFSTAPQDYWDQINAIGSIGEKCYIRTNAPAGIAPDANSLVYRLEIIHED